jgi:hypothetical protein
MLTETDRQIVREFQRRLADVVPVLDLRGALRDSYG